MSGIGFASVANYALTSLATAAGVVAAQQFGSDPGGPYVVSDSTTGDALAILRRPGLESHVYMPGVGWVNGFALSNAIMEDGTQAASVDNPLGYVGDAAQTTLGAELVTNGDFSSGTGWTLASGFTVSGGFLNASGVAAFSLASTPITLVAGRSYQVTYTIVSVTAGGVRAHFAGGTVVNSTSRTTPGTYTEVVTAATGNTSVAVQATGGGFSGVIDNISVRELVGAIPARQATTANKPILRRGAVNRLLWSQDFSNAQWVKTNLSIGTGETAPNGTTTAQKLIATAVTASHRVNYNSSASSSGLGPKTTSIYLKAAEYTTAVVNCSDNVSGDFSASINLTTGVVGTVTTSGTWTSTSITSEDAGNGWWRVRLTGTNATNPLAFISVFPNNMTAYLGNGLSGILAWGAQLETGSTASPYIPTTTAAASSPTGPYWMEFDGTDFLSLAAVPFQMQDDFCVLAGAARTSQTEQRLFTLRTGSEQIALGTTSITALYGLFSDASTAAHITGGVLTLGTTFVGGIRKVGALRQLRLNGATVNSSSTALASTTIAQGAIGVDQSAGTRQWIGSIYPVIVIKGTVTDAELATLERWVASLSGVTL